MVLKAKTPFAARLPLSTTSARPISRSRLCSSANHDQQWSQPDLYEASRTEEASHADPPATMHVLINEPLTAATGEQSSSIPWEGTNEQETQQAPAAAAHLKTNTAATAQSMEAFTLGADTGTRPPRYSRLRVECIDNGQGTSCR